MKYFLVYFLDYKNQEEVSIKQQYKTKEDAENSLEQVAVDFIKELQGRQQAEICKQYEKSVENIQNDSKLGKGLYIKKENKNITLYEKEEVSMSGYLYGLYNTTAVNKLGSYGVTEVNLDVSEFKCSCNLPKISTTLNSLKNEKCQNYISELSNVIGGSNSGEETDLKKIFQLIKDSKKKNKPIVDEKEIFEQVNDTTITEDEKEIFEQVSDTNTTEDEKVTTESSEDDSSSEKVILESFDNNDKINSSSDDISSADSDKIDSSSDDLTSGDSESYSDIHVIENEIYNTIIEGQVVKESIDSSSDPSSGDSELYNDTPTIEIYNTIIERQIENEPPFEEIINSYSEEQMYGFRTEDLNKVAKYSDDETDNF